MQIEIIAGSGFGLRGATYQVEDGKLSFAKADQSDNLTGNGVVEDFAGLTLAEARGKVVRENRENEQALQGHQYDGCHACNWRVSIHVKE